MKLKKLEMILVYLGALLIVGAFILSKDEGNWLGILCVAVGLISGALRLVLSVADSVTKGKSSEIIIGKEKAAPNPYDKKVVLDDDFLIWDNEIKKILVLRPESDRVFTVEAQKRLLPRFIEFVPQARSILKSDTMKALEQGKVSVEKGIGALIIQTELLLRKTDLTHMIHPWKQRSVDLLLDAYLLVDAYYMHPIKGESPGLLFVKQELARILYPKLIELKEDGKHSLTHQKCVVCKKERPTSEMLFADGKYYCEKYFQKTYKV